MISMRSMKQDVLCQKFCKQIGYTFQNPALLCYALTHPSMSKTPEDKKFYQRLEFLGDRVLSLVLVEWLWKLYPYENEAELSKRLAFLACRESLVQVGQSCCLQDYTCFVALRKPRHHHSILADTCEAVIGALYLDGGLSVAEQFIHRYWKDYIQQSVKTDSKTALQEWVPRTLCLFTNLPSYCTKWSSTRSMV